MQNHKSTFFACFICPVNKPKLDYSYNVVISELCEFFKINITRKWILMDVCLCMVVFMPCLTDYNDCAYNNGEFLQKAPLHI